MMRIHRKLFLILIFAAAISGVHARDEVEAPSAGFPERIVQAGSSAFMIENALYMFPEAADRLIAMADGNQGSGFFAADFDKNIGEKTILPRSANTEAILAQNPDTVVMKDFLKGRMGEPLERIGIPTLYLNLETPEAWISDLEKLGILFGNPDRASELQLFFDRRITMVDKSLEGLSEAEKPRTLLLYWSVRDGSTTVNVPPLSWMQTRMVEMAGGIPVWKGADLGERWTQTGIEQIAAWDPDVIIVAAYHVNASKALDSIRSDPTWSSLRAVQNGEIHAFPGDYHSWDQPDGRWIMGLQWLAYSLHPGRFTGLDMVAELKSFYRDFYNMGEDDFERLIFHRLTGLD